MKKPKSQSLKKYNITYKEYNAMWVEQKGVCAICKQPETKTVKGKPQALSVDHNHQTGKVRALLCDRCNYLIGMVRESAAILRASIEYLNKHSSG